MGKQDVWTLYSTLLIFNFLMLMNEKQQLLRDTGLWGKTTKLNQPTYFKVVLTSEWKSGNVLC